MMKETVKHLKTGASLIVLLSLITGLIYPLMVTSIAHVLFPWQAQGSFIKKDGVLLGSTLIGQSFTEAKYFWGRPSATVPFAYNALSSSGSNLGPMNPAFLESINNRIARLQQADPQNQGLIPIDLIMASGSGLDPHISPIAAFYQVSRIAKVRHIEESNIKMLVTHFIEGRRFGILGEPRVNVLKLNLALDDLTKNSN